jgi:DNA-binding CsgD family transcriptional regulator
MNSLTSREREIVLALASGPGFSNKDVARRLNLSEGTVKVHLHNIYDKLRVKNRRRIFVSAMTLISRWHAASCSASVTISLDTPSMRSSSRCQSPQRSSTIRN